MYRKWIYFLALMVFSGIFTLSQAAEPEAAINWQPWSTAIFKQAQQEHKLILIYGKISWCHWCQKMDNSTFTDPRVVKLINNHFIPVKVDIEKDMDTGGRYNIKEIPSLIVLNGHEKEVKRFYGYSSPQTVLRKLTESL